MSKRNRLNPKDLSFDWFCDYEDLLAVSWLCHVLHKLEIPTAKFIEIDSEDLHAEHFCGECEREHVRCNCEEYYRDADDAYDRWRDMEMENDNSNSDKN